MLGFGLGCPSEEAPPVLCVDTEFELPDALLRAGVDGEQLSVSIKTEGEEIAAQRIDGLRFFCLPD